MAIDSTLSLPLPLPLPLSLPLPHSPRSRSLPRRIVLGGRRIWTTCVGHPGPTAPPRCVPGTQRPRPRPQPRSLPRGLGRGRGLRLGSGLGRATPRRSATSASSSTRGTRSTSRRCTGRTQRWTASKSASTVGRELATTNASEHNTFLRCSRLSSVRIARWETQKQRALVFFLCFVLDSYIHVVVACTHGMPPAKEKKKEQVLRLVVAKRQPATGRRQSRRGRQARPGAARQRQPPWRWWVYTNGLPLRLPRRLTRPSRCRRPPWAPLFVPAAASDYYCCCYCGGECEWRNMGGSHCTNAWAVARRCMLCT